MADLDAIVSFATANFTSFTDPLDADQVEALAAHWLPEMRFFEAEQFHPIALQQTIDQVRTVFSGLSEQARDDLRLSFGVRAPDGSAVVEVHDPPAVYEGDGVAVSPGGNAVPVVRVLGSGDAAPALGSADADEDTFVSHGASFGRAEAFFGAVGTLGGRPTATVGDPFAPRIQPMTVMVNYVNLLEALLYETLTESDPDYPPDGMRGGVDFGASLFVGQPPIPDQLQREVTIELIRAHLADDDAAFEAALARLSPFWRLDAKVWDVLTRFAFLEYYCSYAFNDFDRYQTTLFENEHEADFEGFCLVFERNAIDAAAAGPPEALLGVTPHSILTSIHQEKHGYDLFKLLPAGQTREQLGLTVYIAAGSHATYLTPGTHDIADFSDFVGDLADAAGWTLPVTWPEVLALAIVLAIIEHFTDTEDFTSDDGVHGGPEAVVGGDPLSVPTVVQVLAMSADRHLYRPDQRELLRLRAFAGKWGGHDESFDKSPAFVPKTGRYFRGLLRGLF